MSSALEHPQNSSSSSLPRVHRDSEDTSSQSQVTVKEKITKDIISKKISEAEVPFLPKVRGGLHLQLANELQHQERTHHKKKVNSFTNYIH